MVVVAVVGLVPVPPLEAPCRASPGGAVPPLEEAPWNVLEAPCHLRRRLVGLVPPLEVPLELRPAVVATASVEPPLEVPLEPSV